MNRGINFIYERRKQLTQTQLKDQQYFRWSMIGLGVVVGVLLIIIGVRTFFVFEMRKVQDSQATTRQAIQNQEQVEKDYTIFAHKLKALTKLFGQRKLKQDALVFFGQVFGDAAVVKTIDYSSASTNALSFSIETASVFTLDRVFSILSQDQVTEVYPTIKKKLLNRGSDGAYELELTVTLTPAKPPMPPLFPLSSDIPEAGAGVTP